MKPPDILAALAAEQRATWIEQAARRPARGEAANWLRRLVLRARGRRQDDQVIDLRDAPPLREPPPGETTGGPGAGLAPVVPLVRRQKAS